MPRLLAIVDGEAAEPTVFCGCAPFRHKEVQPAGQAFFNQFERKEGAERKEAEAAAESGSDGDGRSPNPKEPKKKKEKKDQEALKLPDCLKGEDLYELLEVEEGASQDDMKKAWRKICLTAHPDKHGDKSGTELEAVNLHFVKLQEAFNILSDVKKRRKYDSMGEFDDWVPTKVKDNQDFFEVFREVFRRNAKWSERKPVPELGDEKTPYEKVKAFYDFWFEFDSWRNLDAMIMEENGEDCFQDLEDAECREEKRWMERENAKLRAKYQKAERQRIFGLAETAEKYDPRVKAEKERQNAAREAAKAAKDAKRIEAERIAREEEERRAAEEEKARELQRIEKAKKDEEKQLQKKARKQLRESIKELNLGINEDQLQEFLLALSINQTDALHAEIKGVKKKGGAGEAVLESMKTNGFEAIFNKTKVEDEKSTEEGSPSEEEVLDPKEAKRREQEEKEKRRKAEERRKKEEEKENKIREEEAAKRAEEKLAREAKKKVEMEKKEKEQQKANKKEAERLKREEEKKLKEEAAAIEKARIEKEQNKKRSEELSQKQKAEKEAEEQAKLLEARTAELERDRLVRCDTFEKMEWPAVSEAAKAALEDPIVAAALAAASQQYEDAEELLDAQLACLGSIFVLGVRPDGNSIQLGSNVRNKVKKHRNRLRAAAYSGDLPLEATIEAAADGQVLEQFLMASRGEGPPPNECREAPAAAPEQAEEAPAASKGKKKPKAKAAPAEEDLDALLKEFDMNTTEKKGKKSGKKK